MRPSLGVLGDELAEAVLALARHRHEGMLGIHHRRTEPVEPPCVNTPSNLPCTAMRVGGRLLRRAVVPVADDLDDLELARLLHHFAEAEMTVAVDRVAGQAAHFEDLAVRFCRPAP